MAEEVNHEAFARLAIAEVYGSSYDPPSNFVKAVITALENLEAHYGEDVVEVEDPTDAEMAGDCVVVYAILDEVEEQLNEAAGELDLDKDQDILRLIEDFKACKRVRKLVKELLDPREPAGAPTEN